jgi:5-oxoprolinase (ATP-hydrolysing)
VVLTRRRHPQTTESWQEGANILSTFLVRDGEFKEKDMTDIFMKAGDYPECMAPRQLNMNMSDLKAQCAACAVGSAQIHALFGE